MLRPLGKTKKHVRNKSQRAQSTMEYLLVMGVIVVILFTMNPFIKRGIQGMIRLVADQVGNQDNAEQLFDDSGHLQAQYLSSSVNTSKTQKDFLGSVNYIYDDVRATTGNTMINAGFIPIN